MGEKAVRGPPTIEGVPLEAGLYKRVRRQLLSWVLLWIAALMVVITAGVSLF